MPLAKSTGGNACQRPACGGASACSSSPLLGTLPFRSVLPLDRTILYQVLVWSDEQPTSRIRFVGGVATPRGQPERTRVIGWGFASQSDSLTVHFSCKPRSVTINPVSRTSER